LFIGFILGPEALGGFLAGATVCGVLMGMFQNNAGGAWDNAKKSFEKGVEINGEMFYKKSEPHKASVTGDTVGDPFKDTSGPSMNILIKLMSIVSLVIAPTLAQIHAKKAENISVKSEGANKIELINVQSSRKNESQKQITFNDKRNIMGNQKSQMKANLFSAEFGNDNLKYEFGQVLERKEVIEHKNFLKKRIQVHSKI